MADAPRRLTCVIADDHPLMVDSLTRLLEAHGIAVLAVATDGEAAIAAIKRHKPRVAVVDVRMPGLTGVEVARRVRLDTAVVLYTGHRDKALVIDGLDAGIRAFVLKEAPPADLLRAIDIAAGKGVYVDPLLVDVISSAEATATLRMLTPRERDVLRLLAAGMRNRDIGERLSIAPDTARMHVRNAMRKLEADTRTHAVALALRQALID
jgi:two-component system nitrate/nitrite response regulator NarL